MKTGLILGISVLVAACGGQTGRQAAAGQDTATIAADSGMQVRYYEGTLPTADGTPINYELELKNEEFSGDGSYDLTMIYPKADKGKDKKFRMIGRWGTLRGSAENPDATVYQLNFGDTEAGGRALVRRGVIFAGRFVASAPPRDRKVRRSKNVSV